MAGAQDLKHFYIPDEQSIYLLSHQDAKKLKDWFALCEQQLGLLGYSDIKLIGKGAFGFAFAGTAPGGEQLVFKFSRLTLPQHVQDRLEDEAFMLGQVKHPLVPGLREFRKIKKQAILVMQRANGMDLEQYSLQNGPLPARLVVKIAAQLRDILSYLRRPPSSKNSCQASQTEQIRPIVHGDIKPSNIVFDPQTEQIGLIDWGSCVYAQLDDQGQYLANNVMDLMSGDLQQTNARLGDVYFIGEQQLNGGLSSPRFDEQGLAGTLYALASGQSCRFAHQVITPNSLGLPKELAEILTNMLSADLQVQQQAGDYFMQHMPRLAHLVFAGQDYQPVQAMIPTWLHRQAKDIETVVYSSRKSFLRAEAGQHSAAHHELHDMDDAQFARYYKQYLQGMGETEKAFIAAISRLGKYPVVGGLVLRWQPDGVYVDPSLNLYNESMRRSFDASVNNVITLARAIHRVGVFKCCLFNAKDTLHIERNEPTQPFVASPGQQIAYELSQHSLPEDESRQHSYFEDGDDPDELLALPEQILQALHELNSIHHTGCIIFEALPKHLKIHSYYTLLDHEQQPRFAALLRNILAGVRHIRGLGISGFMKLPYKDTRHFAHVASQPERYYPRNPKA